jgi:Lon protease-like protein
VPPSARLPLFPLPLVLFPEAALPLHIFEPRYRTMLADCRAGDGRFGVVTGGGEPLPGAVGCVAELREVTMLPDGRANIVVAGGERFALTKLATTGAPYLVGEVEPWRDREEPAEDASLPALAGRVRETFARVARAARTVADDPAPPPSLPADPAALSFAIAAVVELGLEVKLRLLASQSPAGRLRELEALLTSALPGVERRAAVHTGARRNGHGPHAPPGAA